jgi:L-ascorbate metabolism protein UlaG (beta-lactamase superfamily)
MFPSREGDGFHPFWLGSLSRRLRLPSSLALNGGRETTIMRARDIAPVVLRPLTRNPREPGAGYLTSDREGGANIMDEIILFITWIGQACFVLQAGDTTILMDPVPPKMGFASGPVEADVVTVSHEHFDHNCVEMAKGKPVVLRGLDEQKKTWNTIDFKNGDVKITAFPSYHDAQQGAQRGRNAMFLIETKGLRILHTGDLGHALSEETVKKIGRVDVLLICVGGYYTIDAREAKTVIAQLKPRAVVPMHYKTQPTSDLPIADAEPFLKGWKRVRRLDEARFGFTADLKGFPEGETTVLVLPYLKQAEAVGREVQRGAKKP